MEVDVENLGQGHSYRTVHERVVELESLTILDFFDAIPWTKALPYKEWAAWRVWLSAVFGLPLDEQQLEIFRACTGLTDPPKGQIREAWLICGRRSRKSAVAAIVAAYLAISRNYQPYLAPGSKALIPIIAQSMPRANEIMGYLRGIFLTSEGLSELVSDRMKAKSEWTYQTPLDLTNGVTIQVFAASYRTSRGFTAVCILCDEIAFWMNEDTSKNPDKAIISAIKPGLATIPNSLIIGLSSPYAQRGVLWDSYEKHYGKPHHRVLIWKAPTLFMWPAITEGRSPANKALHEEVAEAYIEDPEGAKAEYGAEFRADIVLFLAGELIDGVSPKSLPVRSRDRYHIERVGHPEPGHTYWAFCDASGGSSDSFTLAIGHWSGQWSALDLIREWPAPFNPETVTQELVAELKRWGLDQVIGDAYAGKWPTAAFQRLGVSYAVSRMDKTDIYLAFLPLVTSASCELLPFARLRAQCAALERRPSRARDLIDHPPNAHDDVANAVAGCMVLVDEQRREYQPPPPPPPSTLKELHKQRIANAMLPSAPEADPFARRRR